MIKATTKDLLWGGVPQIVARKGGAAHVVTLVNLTYSDGNYYLVAYSASDEEIRNYRIDRMGQIVATGARVPLLEARNAYNS